MALKGQLQDLSVSDLVKIHCIGRARAFVRLMYTQGNAEIYFEGGSFDGEGMIRRLMRSIETAVKDGFSGFRTAGELTWAAGDTHCKQVIGYESGVAEVVDPLAVTLQRK